MLAVGTGTRVASHAPTSRAAAGESAGGDLVSSQPKRRHARHTSKHTWHAEADADAASLDASRPSSSLAAALPAVPARTDAAAASAAASPTTSASRRPSLFDHTTTMHATDTAQLPRLEKVKLQVEYYFSDENLARDFFLRERMDARGFVPASVLFEFRRLNALANMPQEILVAAIGSTHLQTSNGAVRRRHDWFKFLAKPLEASEAEALEGEAAPKQAKPAHIESPPMASFVPILTIDPQQLVFFPIAVPSPVPTVLGGVFYPFIPVSPQLSSHSVSPAPFLPAYPVDLPLSPPECGPTIRITPKDFTQSRTPQQELPPSPSPAEPPLSIQSTPSLRRHLARSMIPPPVNIHGPLMRGSKSSNCISGSLSVGANGGGDTSANGLKTPLDYSHSLTNSPVPSHSSRASGRLARRSSRCSSNGLHDLTTRQLAQQAKKQSRLHEESLGRNSPLTAEALERLQTSQSIPPSEVGTLSSSSPVHLSTSRSRASKSQRWPYGGGATESISRETESRSEAESAASGATHGSEMMQFTTSVSRTSALSSKYTLSIPSSSKRPSPSSTLSRSTSQSISQQHAQQLLQLQQLQQQQQSLVSAASFQSASSPSAHLSQANMPPELPALAPLA